VLLEVDDECAPPLRQRRSSGPRVRAASTDRTDRGKRLAQAVAVSPGMVNPRSHIARFQDCLNKPSSKWSVRQLTPTSSWTSFETCGSSNTAPAEDQ